MSKVYFFPDFSEENKTLLTNAGVRCWRPYGVGRERGIAVDAENLDLVLYHLGLELFGESERPTDGYEPVFIPKLRNVIPSVTPSVRILNWRQDGHGGDSALFLRAAEEVLLPVLKRQILICGYGDPCNPVSVSSPDFLIHIWSSSEGEHGGGLENRCNTAFGLDIDRQGTHGWNWFGPCGQGELINNPDNNRPIAEIVGDHLYIFPPLHNNRMVDGVGVFRRILEAVVVCLIKNPEERRRLLRERMKATFVMACNALAKEVEDEAATVSGYETALASCKSSLLGIYQNLQSAKSNSNFTVEQVEARIGQEFDSILKIPKVRRVRIQSGNVEVYTDTIFCQDPRSGKWHDIGKFRLVISSTAELPVYFYNQTRTVEGYKSGMHAPHVFPEGKACFGDSKEAFYQLRKQWELPALVMYAIQFLESVNTGDSAGRHIDKWPVKAA